MWELLEVAVAACIFMHSFGVGKRFYPWRSLLASREVVTELTTSPHHRAVWQASSMALNNLLFINLQNMMAITP